MYGMWRVMGMMVWWKGVGERGQGVSAGVKWGGVSEMWMLVWMVVGGWGS